MQYRTGLKIPRSGIYVVRHAQHRLPHEVTLLKDETFPRCAKCDEAVRFELLMGVSDVSLSPFRVILYSIPELEEAKSDTASNQDKAS